jgi:hypothetical protein
MRIEDLRKQQMLARVRDFGAARRDVFPASSRAGKLFAAVAAAIDALEQQLPTQVARGSSQEGSTEKALARDALRRRLATIATMARALALDTPGFADRFSIPLYCSDARLLVIARSFARDAKPLAKEFVAHDMPPDFLAALGKEIDAFATTTSRVLAGKDTRRNARAGIDATNEKAVRAVRQLNAIVRARLQDDRAALALWDNARRLEGSTRPRNGAPPGPPAGPSTPVIRQADAEPVASSARPVAALPV